MTSLWDDPFHPDREGCDCKLRGLMSDDECVHDDPCWVSRAAYEATLPKPDPYTVSDERLREIRALVRADATPMPWAKNHQLAAAIFDLLAERDERTGE